MMKACLNAGTAMAAILLGTAPAWAQTEPSRGAPPAETADSGEEVIVVTAQKREQALSDVGLTISAFSGDTLAQQGVRDPGDLVRIVPGLSYFTTTTATPVFSLRGVGFNESSLSAYPAASVYVDEVPLPFPAMTVAASLDPARVEVLKGPQGTLFGQNSTAGAINYVSTSPTRDFSFGGDLGFSRFSTVELRGFVSGPVAPNAGLRLAVSAVRGNDWQRSYTRDDELGDVERYVGRLIFDWEPTSGLNLRFNLNGWIDKSEPTAAQLVAITPGTPARAFPELLNYPLLPEPNARLADWSPDWGISADDSFWQASLRADWDLGALTLTSITSYIQYRRDQRGDLDGMSLDSTNFLLTGSINSFFQELRIANDSASRLRFIFGANYGHDDVLDQDEFDFTDATGGRAFNFGRAGFFSDNEMTNYAVFGNLEYDITPQLTLKGGARYTRAERSVETCSFDTGDGSAAGVFTFIARRFNPAAPAIGAGDCFTLNPQTFAAGLFTAELNEDNLSWRVGIDYNVTDNLLLYANVSQGYKAGSFPTVQASFQSQYQPVTQESLLAYEGGIKLQSADNRFSFEAAAFYYDYTDKQIRGKIIDPVFGPLEALQNVPQSHVVGAELSFAARPVRGLRLNFAATWLDAKIDEFTGVNGAGVVDDFAGAPMPYTPRWQLAASADYEFPISQGLVGFVGGNFVYHSQAFAAIGTDPVPGTGFNRDLRLDNYGTLDLRAGIGSADDRWRLSIWGRNVTNEYYWNNVTRISDVIVRYPAAPVTYGITLSFRH